jgi:hypothetical protein
MAWYSQILTYIGLMFGVLIQSTCLSQIVLLFFKWQTCCFKHPDKAKRNEELLGLFFVISIMIFVIPPHVALIVLGVESVITRDTDLAILIAIHYACYWVVSLLIVGLFNKILLNKISQEA